MVTSMTLHYACKPPIYSLLQPSNFIALHINSNGQSRISLQTCPQTPHHGFGLPFTEITGKPQNTHALAK
ncbi:hypothetical protein BDZ94DRAFT_1259636 [Collybia nuda]|uniref:Uncharacterized protein n=1 Tax=Collybia nuda TaxID=64659 RepID=A0A9P5Y8I6_9AGAR|nr:hypothetical protein BDZ94DRAFT_1259636 [Collybia nuda]